MQDLINKLFNLKEEFPGMSWTISDSGNLLVSIPITEGETDFLRAACEMFAPAEDPDEMVANPRKDRYGDDEPMFIRRGDL